MEKIQKYPKNHIQSRCIKAPTLNQTGKGHQSTTNEKKYCLHFFALALNHRHRIEHTISSNFLSNISSCFTLFPFISIFYIQTDFFLQARANSSSWEQIQIFFSIKKMRIFHRFSDFAVSELGWTIFLIKSTSPCLAFLMLLVSLVTFVELVWKSSTSMHWG